MAACQELYYLSPNAWMTTAALSGLATSPAALWHLLFRLFLGFEGWFLAATATKKGFPFMALGFLIKAAGSFVDQLSVFIVWPTPQPHFTAATSAANLSPVPEPKPFRLVLRVLHH